MEMRREVQILTAHKGHGALDVISIPEVMKVVLVGLAPWDHRDQGLPATVPPARIKG
jgi:hypothetical protein